MLLIHNFSIMKKIVAFLLSLIVFGNLITVTEAENNDSKIRLSLRERLSTVKDADMVPIIVRFQQDTTVQVKEEIKRLGKVKREFTLINGMALNIKSPSILALSARSEVKFVELDLPVRMNLQGSTKQIGSKQVVDTYGITGKGVKVAVLDTGIAGNHPALRGKVVAQADFTGEGAGTDNNGHGTHVAGIIGSSDVTYRGNAPGVKLYDAKVLNGSGDGSLSGVIAGVEWAVEQGVSVANMSLGAEDPECNGNDALSEAVNAAVDRGVIMVVAAGNSGPLASTINIPGCAQKPITVGAVNDYNSVAYFSSRGLTDSGVVKPDVMAPGVNITSTWNNGGFQTISGTSQATPHTAGVVALMKELKPDLTPSEAKQILKNTGNKMAYSYINTQGQKIINAIAAVNTYYTGQKISTSATESSDDSDLDDAVMPQTGTGSGSETYTLENATVTEEDLEEARTEWIDCSKAALSDQDKKENCLKTFLDVQANFQIVRLASVEIDDLSQLRNAVKALSDKIASDTNLSTDSKNYLNQILGVLNNYIFVGRSAEVLTQAVKNLTSKLAANQLTDSDIDALDNATQKEIAVSGQEKFKRFLNPFLDIDDAEWFWTFVDEIKDLNCVSGYETQDGQPINEYRPANYLTVAESLKVILECSGKGGAEETETASTDPKTSAATNHWAEKYYIRGESLGLTITSNETDDPNRPIMRAEFVQEIIETLGIPVLTEYEAIFSDVPKDNPFAPYVYTAYNKGIISGDSNTNQFRPSAPINRAEVAKVTLMAVGKF